LLQISDDLVLRPPIRARWVLKSALEREENQGSQERAESRAAENQSASARARFAFHLFRRVFD
jgi:hypothetical protein